MNIFSIFFEAFCGLTPLEENFLELEPVPEQYSENQTTENEIISVFLPFSDKPEKYLPPS